MFDMLIFGGPFLGIGAAVSHDWIPEEQFLRWWLIGFVIAGIALWRQMVRFSRFKCPDCEKLLSANEFEADASIYFRCHKCQIDWETGFTHGSD